MKLFFDPGTVAMIGASGRPFRPGNHLYLNLLTCFGDNFFPVNPRQDRIGNKVCYPSILEVPAQIDVAVIFIPAAGVPEALEQCAARGVARVVIESGGFAEVGAEGRSLSERCLAIARAAGMRLWGPNCMGPINVPRRKVLSFLMAGVWEKVFVPGPVSLVVQSGMLSAGFLLDILSRTPFGLAKIASIGNKMDVDETDLLDYLVADPETGVIGLYLESLSRGRRFFELARNSGKPIVVLKAGRTGFGQQAAASHTAALAQDDRMVDAALRQAGVIRVHGMHELMDVARSLGAMPAARPAGSGRVGVLSFSGGAGVVTSDAISDHGLTLARFENSTLAALKSVFPDWMEPANPVDLYPAIEKNGPTRTLLVSLEAVLGDPNVDAVYLHLFAPPINLPIFDYDAMGRQVKQHGKPVVAWTMGNADACEVINRELEKRGIPAVREIERGVRILTARAQGR